MSDILEYPEVVQEVRGALNQGRLKLQSSNVIFKNSKTGRVDQFQSSEVEKVHWLKRARGYCMKIVLKDGAIHRYDGFKETDFEKLSAFVSKFYDSTLEKIDLSVKGWNWGTTQFEGNALSFKVGDRLAFEIPLNNVSHTTTSKNEVTLEFHQNDDAAVSLMELRFHIPSDNTEVDKVQEFYDSVLDKADIIQATGESIATFPEVQCLTPRGRYDIKIYPTFLQLHGKTFDYKIPYATILRLFLLPHKDNRQMFFVVSLDPPIKQGQTRYHFLIMLSSKEDEMTLELSLSEDELEKKYGGKLLPEMSGPEYEVISRIFKAVTNRKITVPGSFKGNSGNQCIGCSYKANLGLLYPLERGFIFVHKPPMHIRFDEIGSVNFARSAGSTRSFDFDVDTKSATVYTFVGIEKDEYGKLYDFVTSHKLRVKNIGGKLVGEGHRETPNYNEDMLDSDVEDNHDAYMERMKAEGKDRQEGDEDDSSDSSDESYNPGGSGSEVAEEYDSNPPTTSTSSSDDDSASGSERERRKEVKRKEKENRKSSTAKTVREGGTRKRKNKKDKDPNRPKRPQSSYFLWLNENREKIKEEYPGISVTDLSKKAGEMWKEVTDKGEWEKKAEEAKNEYQIVMEGYKKKLEEEGKSDDISPKGKSKSKSKKSPSKSPKKSVSESRAGAGTDYKSKEFISSSESSTSDDDKPLKKKPKKEKKKEKKEKEEKEGDADVESGDENEAGDKKETKKSKKGRKGRKEKVSPAKSKSGSDAEAESDEEPGELPEDEAILSTPPSSGKDDSESEGDD